MHVVQVFLPHLEGLNKGLILPPSSSKTCSSSCLRSVFVCAAHKSVATSICAHIHMCRDINNGIHYCALLYCSSVLHSWIRIYFVSHRSMLKLISLFPAAVLSMAATVKKINPILRTVLALTKDWNSAVCTLDWLTCRLGAGGNSLVVISYENHLQFSSGTRVFGFISAMWVNQWKFYELVEKKSEKESFLPCAGSLFFVMKWNKKGIGKKLARTVLTAKTPSGRSDLEIQDVTVNSGDIMDTWIREGRFVLSVLFKQCQTCTKLQLDSCRHCTVYNAKYA